MLETCSSSLLILLIGTGIGFILSVLLILIKDWLLEKRQKKLFLSAIKSEVSNVWEHYYEDAGKTVEKLQEKEAFDWVIPVSMNYFTVYDNNSNMIGLFDEKLNSLLVKTYILAKSLTDAFVYNNQLLKKREMHEDTREKNIGSDRDNVCYENYVQLCKDYGDTIKKLHVKLQESKNALIQSINEKLKCSN